MFSPMPAKDVSQGEMPKSTTAPRPCFNYSGGLAEALGVIVGVPKEREGESLKYSAE